MVINPIVPQPSHHKSAIDLLVAGSDSGCLRRWARDRYRLHTQSELRNIFSALFSLNHKISKTILDEKDPRLSGTESP